VVSKPSDRQALVGSEFPGFNVGRALERLGSQKFIKGFFDDEAGVEGYKNRVEQTGLSAPCLHRPSPDQPERFEFFQVRSASAATNDSVPTLCRDCGSLIRREPEYSVVEADDAVNLAHEWAKRPIKADYARMPCVGSVQHAQITHGIQDFAPPAGFEPATSWSEARRSNPLSYRGMGWRQLF
jgi:hypothetical protein